MGAVGSSGRAADRAAARALRQPGGGQRGHPLGCGGRRAGLGERGTEVLRGLLAHRGCGHCGWSRAAPRSAGGHQRRSHGGLLLRRRAGGQARVHLRRAPRPQLCGAAGRRRVRDDGGRRAHLLDGQPDRWRQHERVGDPDRHRHRLRPCRARARREARARRVADVHAHARRRRRPGHDRRHRRLLLAGPLTRLADGRRTHARRGCGHAACRRSCAHPVRRRGGGAVGRRARVRGPRHHRRCRPRVPHAGPTVLSAPCDERGDRRSARQRRGRARRGSERGDDVRGVAPVTRGCGTAHPYGARAAPVVRLCRTPGLRSRQRRRRGQRRRPQ